jgi:hypothetical protein
VNLRWAEKIGREDLYPEHRDPEGIDPNRNVVGAHVDGQCFERGPQETEEDEVSRAGRQGVAPGVEGAQRVDLLLQCRTR